MKVLILVCVSTCLLLIASFARADDVLYEDEEDVVYEDEEDIQGSSATAADASTPPQVPVKDGKFRKRIDQVESELQAVEKSEQEQVDVEEDEFYFDEDEFEGFDELEDEQRRQLQVKSGVKLSASSSENNVLFDAESELSADEIKLANAIKALEGRSYVVEAVYVAFLIVYGVNFLYGRWRNESIAYRWFDACKQQLREQFVHVGPITDIQVASYGELDERQVLAAMGKRNDDDDDEDDDDDAPSIGVPELRASAVVEKHSQNEFVVTATGRQHCYGVQAKLTLRKRHDLVSLAMGLVRTTADTLTIEVPMRRMAPLVFVVARSTAVLKAMQSKFNDIALYPQAVPGGNNLLPGGFVVRSDAPDRARQWMTSSAFTKMMRKHAELIESIHFTDSNPLSATHKQILRFVFRLPSIANVAEFDAVASQFMEAALHFVDAVAAAKLTNAEVDKLQRIRARADKELRRTKQEENQERLERIANEKRERELKKREAMTPEQRAKYDKRMERKQAKKQQNKYKKVIMG
jgi:PAT complex subunit CCDC47